MSTPLEDMEADLDAACVAELGDTIQYRAAGAPAYATILAYVDHADGQRAFESGPVVEQDISIELPVSSVPAKPGPGCRVTLPRIAGPVFEPVNVRRASSGTHWAFELKRVAA